MFLASRGTTGFASVSTSVVGGRIALAKRTPLKLPTIDCLLKHRFAIDMAGRLSLGVRRNKLRVLGLGAIAGGRARAIALRTSSTSAFVAVVGT